MKPNEIGSLDLLTPSEMDQVDRNAVESGLGIDRLMLAAGRAVADRVHDRLGTPGRIAVLCGPGNNGGDGFVAARLLSEKGHLVTIHTAGLPPSGGAAGRVAAFWEGITLPLSSLDLAHCDCIVDALFGSGLSRAIDGEAANAVAMVNRQRVPVIAIDVPSGLSGATGWPIGGIGAAPCIEADETVTFFRRKPGHLLWPGRRLCGKVTLAQVGLTETHRAPLGATTLFENSPGLWRDHVPQLAMDTHKYLRGHCAVLSGGELQSGASRLAAIAAANAGCGAVTIAGTRAALLIQAAHVTSIMLHELDKFDAFGEFLISKVTAVVIGPGAGVGADTLAYIQAALGAKLPTVIDADGITSLKGHLYKLAERNPACPTPVLTPHEGEFERVFGPCLEDDATYCNLSPFMKQSKVEKARAAARISQAIIVYKGPDTVIASPDGRAAINVNGGPQLATAGSGDVLSGLTGANLAQGMSSFEAAAAAVWQHGRLAEELGRDLTADKLAAAAHSLAAMTDQTW